MTTRERMINHIHSMNVALTVEWLEQQEDEILLANCHPTDREKYASDLKYVQQKKK